MFDVLCTELSSYSTLLKLLQKMKSEGQKDFSNVDFSCWPYAINTPAALARLGIKTAFSTLINTDTTGQLIEEYLKSSSVDFSPSIRTDKIGLNSKVLVDKSVEMNGYYLTEKDYKQLSSCIDQYARESVHIHTYLEDCLRLPITAVASKYSNSLSIDINIFEGINLKDISEILGKACLLFVNEKDACYLTKCLRLEDAVAKIGKLCKIVVVRLDNGGSLIKTMKKLVFLKPENPVRINKESYADDLYSAGFLYGMIRNWSLRDTCLLAVASRELSAEVRKDYCMENILRNCGILTGPNKEVQYNPVDAKAKDKPRIAFSEI